MNAIDILKNGHQTVVAAVDGLDDVDWQRPGACGEWSIKDIIAHLASFERVLVELLGTMLPASGSTSTLDRFINDFENFNDAEVIRRRTCTVAEIWTEYEGAHEMAMSLLAQIPVEKQRGNGSLPWYGDQYDLEDFLVYTYYGHKREHCAQIMAFRDRLHLFEDPWGVYA